MSDVRQAMCEVIEELYRCGLITATGGNVSARCPDQPTTAWITPRGMFKGALSPDIMVRMNERGEPAQDALGTPSSESKIHAAILAASGLMPRATFSSIWRSTW